MLNWEEYNSEEQIPTAVKANTYAVPQAEPALAQNTVAEPMPVYADRVAVEKAGVPPINAVQITTIAHEPTVADAEIAARARAVVEKLDAAPGLEELEMGAARLLVDDKRMINCRADLNQ
ncbi:MAG TPA: ribonucleotide-diphosphate reductase subunit beta, partial [Spongiibacteraceae bacterium]